MGMGADPSRSYPTDLRDLLLTKHTRYLPSCRQSGVDDGRDGAGSVNHYGNPLTYFAAHTKQG
jgi:hypothetical protein